MSEPLGAAINACGWVATEHARAYMRNPHVRIVGVTSRTRASAERLVEQMGLDCRIYPDYEALLADDDVDIVSVTTPNFLHASDAIAAAQAGKHICLEKPVAITEEELDELGAAVEAAGVTSVVSFVLRWNQQVVNVKNLVERGALGELFYCETDYWHGVGEVIRADRWLARRELAGSAMLTGGCHAVDMARNFMGEVASVTAHSHFNPSLGFDYDTATVCTVEFESGAIGKISAILEIVSPYRFNVAVMGSEGTALGNEVFSRVLAPQQEDYFAIPCVTPSSGDVEHHPFQQEIDHLVECILQGRDCAPNIADGIRTSRVCLAADRSAATGGRPEEPSY
ncbi:MAG: Gfo/Idh/MocA family protein [Armatimonadota bacterium]